MKAFTAQARAEVLMTIRRGESLLLTIGIPVGLLLFFSAVDLGFTDTRHPVDFLTPGIIALAVMSTAMVSLGIATGFERQYGVLKRLGATPLGRSRLLAAKTAAIVGVEVVQVVLLAGVGLALGWRPHGNAGAGVLGAVLATIAFAGLGLLMAGSLRAEMTLAAANGLYLVLLLIGGMVVPLGKLPAAVRAVARLLPSAALSDVLHATIGSGGHIGARPWIVLAVWAVAAPAAAAAWFKWE